MDPKPRILIVDPDADHLQLLQRSLRDLGSVETASSGEEGLALASASDPHVVIADQRLPGISGLELLNQAGERDAHVGRILLTNYGDTQVTIDAVECGRVDAFVGKPCMPHQLRLQVRSVLERCELERTNAALVETLTAKNSELRGALDSLRTAQRRVVDAERLGAIGRMIAMIVHDLRSPLTVLRAGVEEIASGKLENDELIDVSTDLSSEIERMTRMCSDLLSVSRASGGGLSQSRLLLDDVVEGAASALAREAVSARVEIQAHLQAPVELMLDGDRFRRALLNLGYNAIEAMPGGGTLRLATRITENEVVVLVQDTGGGIPAEVADRIFEPFVTSGKSGGSGLGLSVVKKVVEDHGGQIQVKQPKEGGTAFLVHLPERLFVDP